MNRLQHIKLLPKPTASVGYESLTFLIVPEEGQRHASDYIVEKVRQSSRALCDRYEVISLTRNEGGRLTCPSRPRGEIVINLPAHFAYHFEFVELLLDRLESGSDFVSLEPTRRTELPLEEVFVCYNEVFRKFSQQKRYPHLHLELVS